MKLMIVESPSKAKTIEKYLGSEYKVMASYGHIRDLVPKDGSVDTDHDFEMKWEIDSSTAKHIKSIEKVLTKADEILLATDPDREGEAISWHLVEIFQNKLKSIPVKRVVFYEITKTSVKNAITSAREINQSLVDAYLTRRALDYLVGFKLSPILWRKLPKSKSAGRVQSVALRLIYEKECEIEKFKTEEYWSLVGRFGVLSVQLKAKLIKLYGRKLDKLDIKTIDDATKIKEELEHLMYKVLTCETKNVSRRPFAPFITSTLQQEASQKLGYSARQTMSLAQKLYEGMMINGEDTGLITYMRTDSVNLSDEAIIGTRNYISQNYGTKYLPKSKVQYVNKVKNAQEAHEAIRPTRFDLSPENLKGTMPNDLWALYDLIWKRTIASQMENAILNQVVLDIADLSEQSVFRATGSNLVFDGFLKIYDESNENKSPPEPSDLDKQLLPLCEKETPATFQEIVMNQHFTKPPFRYTEASLVKKLEEMGIGRPSTYANILYVLQQRGYVKLKSRKFFVENMGRFVSSFLKNFFSKYVEFDFTANLEQQLDDVSNGQISWKEVLRSFWDEFHANIMEAEKLKITDVINYLEKDLNDYLFPNTSEVETKQCPSCDGTLSLKLGRYGAFIACAKYPDCSYTRKIDLETVSNSEESIDVTHLEAKKSFEDKLLGVLDGTDVFLKKGPYGFYVQSGIGAKPKRVAIPATMDVNTVDFEIAKNLLSLPKTIGTYNESEIVLSIGKFGPYLKHSGIYYSIKNINQFFNCTLDDAIEIITTTVKKKKPVKEKPETKITDNTATEKSLKIKKSSKKVAIKKEGVSTKTTRVAKTPKSKKSS